VKDDITAGAADDAEFPWPGGIGGAPDDEPGRARHVQVDDPTVEQVRAQSPGRRTMRPATP
jgi:hypothetical protein